MDLESLGRINNATKAAIQEVGQFKYKREIYREIEKHLEGRNFLGFYGLRGVGKTTILKMLLAAVSGKYRCAYVNSEASYLIKYSLDEIITSLSKEGFQYIFVDEIHEKSNWENAILTAFDEKSARVCFTGSSAIAIQAGSARGDLTRKTTFFHISPLSFREFLFFRNKSVSISKKLSLQKLLSQPRQIALELIETEKYYSEYLKTGGLMYDSIDYQKFTEQVMMGIKRSMEKDIIVFKGLGLKEQNDALSSLYLIARSSSYEITKENLGNELGISWRETQSLIDLLQKVGLITLVSPCGKEERKGTGKIYLPMPLRSVLANDRAFGPDVGSLREEFFVQHILNCGETRNICYPKGQKRLPDFFVNGKYFEIGGRSKGKGQKADYYVLESTQAEKNIIPLFLFGFLY